MTDIKRIGDTGVNTVEGTIAGPRAAQLAKDRGKQKEEYESQKNKIKLDNSSAVDRIDSKFSVKLEEGENDFRKKTLGLVSLSDYRDARAMASALSLGPSASAYISDDKAAREKDEEDKSKLKAEKNTKKRKEMAKTLSFLNADEDEDEDEDGADDSEEPLVLSKKNKKNPNVDTSFLPDRDRDQVISTKRQELSAEWLRQQELVKQEELLIVYSYWDGSGHRKEIKVKKGFTVSKFLAIVKEALVKEFPELRSMNAAEGLMYIKEDLIIPNNVTFYDLIVTKARGKSGPLFNFTASDDIRLVHDIRVEKDDAHPGKVVGRAWYEKNKHIFPASRWEVFDINKSYGEYTIHG